MRIRFNSIGLIFICLSIIIASNLITQTDARTLSHNLRAGALRNIQIHNEKLREKRSFEDNEIEDLIEKAFSDDNMEIKSNNEQFEERHTENDDEVEKRDENEDFVEKAFDDDNMEIKSNNEQFEERHTENDDDFEERFFQDNNSDENEAFEQRELDNDKKRK